jgi:hypothetical protein
VISRVRQGARLNAPSGRIVGLDQAARSGEPLAGLGGWGLATRPRYLFDLAVEGGLLTVEVWSGEITLPRGAKLPKLRRKIQPS